jgi:hypothetical protein
MGLKNKKNDIDIGLEILISHRHVVFINTHFYAFEIQQHKGVFNVIRTLICLYQPFYQTSFTSSFRAFFRRSGQGAHSSK